ncbi:MAG: hypothetical protein ACKO66_01320, partial [Flavobacteriales bacterium]
MRKLFLSLVILLELISLKTSAQERVLQVQIQGAIPPNSQIIFEQFRDDKWTQVSTVPLNTAGMSNWKVSLSEPR